MRGLKGTVSRDHSGMSYVLHAYSGEDGGGEVGVSVDLALRRGDTHVTLVHPAHAE